MTETGTDRIEARFERRDVRQRIMALRARQERRLALQAKAERAALRRSR